MIGLCDQLLARPSAARAEDVPLTSFGGGTMRRSFRSHRLLPAYAIIVIVLGGGLLLCMTRAGDTSRAEPDRPAGAPARPQGCWRVEDVRPGQKGYGLTVMKGTKIE